MNPKFIRTVKNFWPIILWALFVFILSSTPGNYFPKIPSFWDWLKPDKVVHLVFYGVFSYLLLLGMIRQYDEEVSRLKLKMLAFLAGMFFGLALEVLQYYVFIGRSGNVYDFIANTIGSATGIFAFGILNRKKLVK
ncbi:MAG: VanZ family protein [Bacteroidales bacterium]|nr:VanZ family protein [Bacteroidales bacterium]MCF8386696.1 VanZ family protein [Bacteroidales bacterium]MCF8397231.1 VanZ family protein [Bacteroidales bacterium]